MLRSDVHKPGTLKGMVKSEVNKPDTFLYFAYGGNILTFRTHMHSPSAEFVAIARLDNFRLDFIKYTKFWGGPTPTLVPTANAHVWGVIWRVHRDDLPNLEMYKGMGTKRSFVNHVFVSTCHMGQFKCRVYIARINPLPRGDNDAIPVGRWPSVSIKHVMILGAIEHEFPPYYIHFLRGLRDNGERGLFEQECLLRRYCASHECECEYLQDKLCKELLVKELPNFKKTLEAAFHKKKSLTKIEPEDNKDKIEDEEPKDKIEDETSKDKIEDEKSMDNIKDEITMNKIDEEKSKDRLVGEKLEDKIEDAKSISKIESDQSQEKIKDEKSKEKIGDEKSINKIQDEKSRNKLEDEKSKGKIEDEKSKEKIEDEKSKEKIGDEKSINKIQDEKSKNKIEDEKSKLKNEDEESKEKIENEKSKEKIGDEKSIKKIQDEISKNKKEDEETKEKIEDEKSKEKNRG